MDYFAHNSEVGVVLVLVEEADQDQVHKDLLGGDLVEAALAADHPEKEEVHNLAEVEDIQLVVEDSSAVAERPHKVRVHLVDHHKEVELGGEVHSEVDMDLLQSLELEHLMVAVGYHNLVVDKYYEQL